MKKLSHTLVSILNIRPGEERAVILMFIHSFFLGVAAIFLGTASYALFLAKFDAKILPWVYIIAAVVNTALGYVYSRFERRLSLPGLLRATVIFLLAAVGLLYLAMASIDSRWTVMALIICYNVFTVLANLEFWGLAGHLLNVRQGKRLFGLIGSGWVTAAIIGGLSVPHFVDLMGTVHLLSFSTVAMVLCLGVLIYTTRVFSHQLGFSKGEGDGADGSGESPFKDRYLRFVFVVAAFSIFGYYLLDYIFYDLVEAAHTLPGAKNADETSLAAFLGVFYALFRVFSLVNNTLLYGRLINRFGIGLGLLAVPVTAAAGLTAGLITNFFVPVDNAFFWVVVGAKLFDEVFRVSIEEPSMRILYQPIPAGQRLRAQAANETMVETIAGAAAGLVLLFLTSVLKLASVHLMFVLFVLVIGWITMASALRKEYTVVLTRALRKRASLDVETLLRDAKSREVLKERLYSNVPGEAIYCLDLLEEIEHEQVGELMTGLLQHNSPEVRRHVLHRMETLSTPGALNPINAMLRLETDPVVRGQALRTLCALSGAEAFETVYPHLEDEEIDTRQGAMIGLLRYGGIEGMLSAGKHLHLMQESKIPSDRQLAAKVLGEVGTASFYRPLLKLMRDDNVAVQRTAIVSAGMLKNPKLLPPLVEKFSIPSLRSLAVSAVVAFGEPVLPELARLLGQEIQPREVRVRIIRIMGRIGGRQAIDILKRRLDMEEEDIRNHILRALLTAGYRAAPDEVLRIQQRIRDEAEDAAWTMTALMDIGDHEFVSELHAALAGEIDKNRERIFQMLAMIYPAEAILDARNNLNSVIPEKRPYAMEVLDNIVSPDLKTFLFPLIEDQDMGQRLLRLAGHFPQQRMNQHERLKEILKRGQHECSSWTKACSLFTIGRIATMEFFDTVIESLTSPDPTVRETGVWALGCLNPNDLGERLKPLTRDRHPRVAEFARFVTHSVGFASIPMSRGYLTRSGRYTVDLFKNILDDEGERRSRRCRAAAILARFKSTMARDALMDGLTISDKIIRTAVLDALLKGEFQILDRRREDLSRLLRIEINDARRVVKSIAVLFPEPHSDRLVHALNHEIVRSRRRILTILALLHGADERVAAIFYWHVHQEKMAIPEAVTADLQALLGRIPDEGSRRHAMTLFMYRDFREIGRLPAMRALHTPENVERHLGDIAFGTAIFTLSWSRLCALEMIVRLELAGFVPRIVENLADRDDIVRATSAWALFKLSPDAYQQHARTLLGDSSPLVSRTLEQLASESRQLEGEADRHAANH